jgi:D-aminopeptidase
MDLEQDLRTVSDDMMSTLDQLQKLESEKRAETPGSPRFVRLAREIERLAAVVFTQTSAQQSLAERTHAAIQAGAQMTPIKDVTPMRDVSLILSEWRDAERRLSATAVDTAEHSKAAGDVRRLREEYHRAYQAQKADASTDR